MDEILKDLDFCFAYLDDILFFGHFPQRHDQHLRIPSLNADRTAP